MGAGSGWPGALGSVFSWLSRAGSVSWGRVWSQSPLSSTFGLLAQARGVPVQPRRGLSQPHLPGGTRDWQVLFWVLCRGLCELFLPAHPCTAAAPSFVATFPPWAERRHGGVQGSGGPQHSGGLSVLGGSAFWGNTVSWGNSAFWLCCCCSLEHSPAAWTCGTLWVCPGHRGSQPQPCPCWGFMQERVQPCPQLLVFPSSLSRPGAWVRFVPVLIGTLISPAGKMGVPDINLLCQFIIHYVSASAAASCTYAAPHPAAPRPLWSLPLARHSSWPC